MKTEHWQQVDQLFHEALERAPKERAPFLAEPILGHLKQIGYERDGVKEPLDDQGWEPITTFTADEFVVTFADGGIPIRGRTGSIRRAIQRRVDWMGMIGEDAGKSSTFT